MQRMLCGLCLCAVLGAAEVRAQELKADGRVVSEPALSLGQLTPTPGMWFYEQGLKQYNNPKQMVRQKAEFDAWQRKYRVASSEWFGISKSRPTAQLTPIMSGTYADAWVGNQVNPNQWSAYRGGGANVIIESTARASSAGYGLW